jgi:hypothetical protein
MRKNVSQSNLQFGQSTMGFDSTLLSGQSTGRLNVHSAMNIPQMNAIMPHERHYITISGDNDTYMMNSTYSLRGTGRAASQGKINLENKNFDIKTLLLPNINTKGQRNLDKSQTSQMFFDKQSVLFK